MSHMSRRELPRHDDHCHVEVLSLCRDFVVSKEETSLYPHSGLALERANSPNLVFSREFLVSSVII